MFARAIRDIAPMQHVSDDAILTVIKNGAGVAGAGRRGRRGRCGRCALRGGRGLWACFVRAVVEHAAGVAGARGSKHGL